MCPGASPGMAQMPSLGDREEGLPHTFTRSLSNQFQQSWEEMLKAQSVSPEALAALFCSSLENLYVESGSCRKHIFEEFSKRVFTSIAMCLTFALAGLDVLSRHLSYPSRAAAAGRSRVITGYFGFTISSANLFFNLSLYAALCCLCILLYLKVSALVFNSRLQVVLQPMDVTEPDAAQRKSEAITAQVEAVMDLPFLLFFGCLNGPLKTISLFSLLLASLASIFSFVFPTLWQLFFWTVAIVVVFVASTAVTGALSSPAAGPIRDLGA